MLFAMCIVAVFMTSISGTLWGAAGEPKTPENTSAQQFASMAKDSNLTLVQAVGRALEKVSGKAVQAELQKKDQKIVWEVTVFTEKGILDRVYVDGKDGSYLLPVSPSHGRQ